MGRFSPLIRCMFLLALASGPARAAEMPRSWSPVPPELLAEEHAQVEAGAAAEFVSYDEWIRLSLDPMSLTTMIVTRDRWVRVKVFTDEGAQVASRVDIDAPPSGTRLEMLEGRTIAPDGSVATVKRSDIFEEAWVRVNNRRLKRYSFAMPRVVRGSVLDYHVREVVRTSNEEFTLCRFAFGRAARRVTYHLKGPAGGGVVLKYRLHRVAAHAGVPAADGFQEVTASAIPASSIEPLSPPLEATLPLMLVYLGSEGGSRPGDFWQDLGHRYARGYEVLTAPEGRTRRLAESLVGDERDPERKAGALLRWLRSAFVIVKDDDAAYRAKGFKRAESVEQAVVQRGGNEFQAILAFGALSRAVGIETRLVLANSSFVGLFDEGLPMQGLLPIVLVAMKVGAEWKIFDPGVRHLAWDMVRMDAEGRQALICEASISPFVTVPASGPEHSGLARDMHLELSSDGRLDGSGSVQVRGHLSRIIRWIQSDESRADADTLIRNLVAPDDPLRSLRVDSTATDSSDSACVRVFARFRSDDAVVKTARRMVLEARSILVSEPPRLDAPVRAAPIELPMAWVDQDSIVIRIPSGWQLDALDPPAERNVPGVLGYRCEWVSVPERGLLVLRRRLELGIGGRIWYPASAYANLRGVFNELHRHDGLTASLIRTDGQ